MRIPTILSSTLVALLLAGSASAQSPAAGGKLRGTVLIEPFGTPARNAVVTIVELNKSALTDENGAFVLTDVPAGTYQFITHLDRVPDVVKTVAVMGGDQKVDLQLTLAPVSEQVTVTASG